MNSFTSDPFYAGGDEEVDIMTVSDEKETSPKKRKISMEEKPTESMQIDDVSMKVTSESEPESETESDFDLFEVPELTESDEEQKTESRRYGNLPPNFPVRFTTLILEPELLRPRILMEKILKITEGDGDQLSIPARKVKEAFLVPEEEEALRNGGFMDVDLVEWDGFTVSTLQLRGRRRRSYVLTGGWKGVVERNREALRTGRFVRVWYFRVDGLLWFALQVVNEKDKDSEMEKQITRKWYAQNNFGP